MILTIPLGLIVPPALAEALIVGFTVMELLVAVRLPSVAVMLTAEPAAFTVTEVDATPLTKAFTTIGLIGPAEYVKNGLPV